MEVRMLTFDFTLSAGNFFYEFAINENWDCSNDKPILVWELKYNFKTIFGIEIIKVYNSDYSWDTVGEYKPYFKKWRIQTIIGKFIKTINERKI
jgi:hypothetical protein